MTLLLATTGEWIRFGAVAGGGIVLAVLATRVVGGVLERAGSGRIVARLGGRAVSFLLVVVAAVYALAAIKVQIGPLLGALGVGGIALAFALQQILANFVAGVLLQVRRPFRIGDMVRTGDYEGVVEDVNLRVTELTTYDGLTVFIPNATVLDSPITNITRTPLRRITLGVGVAYDTRLERAREVLLAAIRGVPEVEAEPAPGVWVTGFGDSSIDLALLFWYDTGRAGLWATRDAVARAVKLALDDEGIAIPFPQRTLWFGPGSTELALRSAPPG